MRKAQAMFWIAAWRLLLFIAYIILKLGSEPQCDILGSGKSDGDNGPAEQNLDLILHDVLQGFLDLQLNVFLELPRTIGVQMQFPVVCGNKVKVLDLECSERCHSGLRPGDLKSSDRIHRDGVNPDMFQRSHHVVASCQGQERGVYFVEVQGALDAWEAVLDIPRLAVAHPSQRGVEAMNHALRHVDIEIAVGDGVIWNQKIEDRDMGGREKGR
uniref:Putative secreted protein n=1 Tax=Ixodes ricinus TaxID=34613 RepID=A0A6B0V382_IXORI